MADDQSLGGASRQLIGIVRDNLLPFEVKPVHENIDERQWLLNNGYLLGNQIQKGAYSRVYEAWTVVAKRKSQLSNISTKRASDIRGSIAESVDMSAPLQNIKDRFLANLTPNSGSDESNIVSPNNTKEGTESKEEQEFRMNANANYTKREMRAIKIVDFSSEKRKDVREKHLPREIDLQKRIRHPHIVRLYLALGPMNNKMFLVQEYVNGGDLYDYLKKWERLTVNQSRVWFRQLCWAVEYLHGQGIAHRDIKLENILFCGRGSLKLTDFGFARPLIDPEKEPLVEVERSRTLEQNRTKSIDSVTTYVGTRYSAAPEVLEGSRFSVPYDPRPSDIWSLGVVLYYMVSGRTPFPGQTSTEQLKTIRHREVVIAKLPKRIFDSEKNLVRLINKLFSIDPAFRPKVAEILTSPWILEDPFHERVTREYRITLERLQKASK